MEDMELKYDSICYHIFVNLMLSSKNAKVIAFKNFNYKNDEHKLLVAVASACNGLLGDKDIAVDGTISGRVNLRKRYNKVATIKRTTKEHKDAINAIMLLEKLHRIATEQEGGDFDFGEIYHAYYGRKEQ